MTSPPPDPRWSRRQIQAARRADLPPLLVREGLRLRPRHDGNFELPDFAGLIVKRNYWCWIDTDKGGNAIDFFVVVLGRTFHQAMSVIMEQIERDGR